MYSKESLQKKGFLMIFSLSHLLRFVVSPFPLASFKFSSFSSFPSLSTTFSLWLRRRRGRGAWQGWWICSPSLKYLVLRPGCYFIEIFTDFSRIYYYRVDIYKYIFSFCSLKYKFLDRDVFHTDFKKGKGHFWSSYTWCMYVTTTCMWEGGRGGVLVGYL